VVVTVQTTSEVVLCVLDYPSDLFIFEKDAFKHVYIDRYCNRGHMQEVETSVSS